MRIQLATGELRRLLPVSPGTAAHVRRVAALSREVAGRLAVSWRALSTLEQAALLHHLPADRRESGGLPEDLLAVLRAFDGAAEAPDRNLALLSRILLATDAVDQQWESLAWDPRPIEGLWKELDEIAWISGEPPAAGGASGRNSGDAVWKAVHAALRCPYRPVAGRRWPLPVNGQVVAEVVAALRRPETEVPEMARLAARDPVLAGNVLAAANSAWYGRRTPARTVREALTYIGPESGRRVLLALALKPLFGSSRLSALWRHAVDLAVWCEALAAMTGLMPPAEAMLLGLIHDVGRVAVLAHGAVGPYARLIEWGCPPVYTEQLLFGEDHGEIGAGILDSWGFAEDLTAAVCFHHRPADCPSTAAAMLYLAEFWSASDEDLPSARHMDIAQRRTGCSIESLALAGRRAATPGDLSIVA
ncbi:MAG: HDOD domain-containing protein [Acidobacteria bacterium]|nr:HDOD domain-containing protein [Acidobacteriota bacterium]